MNKIITLTELAEQIAALTQCSAEDAENFVRETFRLATETIETERAVEIPGIGTFKITDETISYAPDEELATEINAPFSAFEAIELPEDIEETQSQNDTREVEEIIEDSHAINELTEEKDNIAEPTAEEEEIAAAAEFEEKEDADIKEEEKPQKEHKSRNYSHWIWAAACLMCFGLGWFAREFKPGELTYTTQLEEEYTEEEITAIPADTLAEVEMSETPVAPAIPVKVITDTISSTRYLTTMARQHYGQMEYWVYIYEANKDKLGHPDKLNSGTVVIIPQLEFHAGNESKIAEAKRLATEIYARFN